MLREDEFVNYTTGEQAGCVSVGLAKGKFRRTVKACLEEVRPVLLPRSLPFSWLRVSGSAKMPQIDQRVSHQLHTVMASLFELKAQQKPFEFVLPREGPLHAES